MPSELPEVSVGVAQVWHVNGRRYLTKRSAYGAKARAWMMRDHEDISHSDWEETGEHCVCLFCRDHDKKIHKRLTRFLMRRDDGE